MKPRIVGLLFALPLVTTASDTAAQQPNRRAPLAQGSVIDARDGDTILIPDDARVRVIRRRRAHIRVVFDSTQHLVILLARYEPQNGVTTDGIDAYTFRDIDGEWTVATRWEGDSTIDVYSMA